MISAEVLQGTLFSCVYNFFRVSGDDELVSRMTMIAIIYTIVVGFGSIAMPAPYGKHSSGRIGFTISARAAWIIQESPAFIVPLVLIIQTPCLKLQESYGNKVGLFLFMAHYFNRAFIFPFRIINSRPAPLISCIMAFIFCVFNGLLQGLYMTNVQVIEYSEWTILGAAIAITGMSINIYYDGVLIGLRKSRNNKSEGKSDYNIPRGGLFELISGANYLGEIVEWWGWFIVTKGYPQLTFAVFSNVFLGLRACHHHQWYKKTFGSLYPAKRKAIVPYVI